MVTRAASKNIRKRLMHGSESVDTEYAIVDNPHRRGRSFVDAKQHHGRLERDGCNGSRGYPCKTRRAICRDNMDGRGDAAHRGCSGRKVYVPHFNPGAATG